MGAWAMIALALVLLRAPVRADSPPADSPLVADSPPAGSPPVADSPPTTTAQPAPPKAAPVPSSPSTEPASAPSTPVTPPRKPLYKSAWLWSAAGALVVIAVAGVVAARVSAEWANAPNASPGRAAAALSVRW